MNHLLVSYHTCPLEEPGTGLSGGMNVFLRGLLRGLARRGIRTLVLTRGRGDKVVETRPHPGVRIAHLPCGWVDPPSRESAYLALAAFTARARAFLAEEAGRWDVVSAHYWMSGVAASDLLAGPLRGVPFLFAYHTVEIFKTPPRAHTGLFAARVREEKRLSCEADRIVCFTEEDLARTERAFPDAAGKCAVIPPGVDTAFCEPPSGPQARARLGVPADAVVFFAAARSDPGKRVEEAVAAAREPDCKQRWLVLVAGQEPPGGKNPSGVRYLGPVPHSRMPQCYAAADAVVCPSAYESFGFVQLEALSAGVPVIVPAGGYWGRRIASEGGGLIFPAGDTAALREAMERLAADPSLRRRLGVQARRMAEPFTWERCTQEWELLLSRAATPGSPR